MKRFILLLAYFHHCSCGFYEGFYQDMDFFTQFTKGNHNFTAAVYKELSQDQENNILFSPLSVEMVMLLASVGAPNPGETGSEIRAAFRCNDMPFLIPMMELTSKLETDPNIQIALANKVYVNEDFTVKDTFVNMAVEVFKGDVENVPMVPETADNINSWVESHTNNKIHNLIKPFDIDDDTKLILVNALYFQGSWMNTFDPVDTFPSTFFNYGTSMVPVDTMHKTDTLNYYESLTLDAKFVELPYNGGSASMTIVLPNTMEGLSALESNLDQVFERPNYEEMLIDLSLPKFKLEEQQISFRPILEKLGIKKAFSSKADFSDMAYTTEPLYISSVIQKTFIEVGEKGTEAAAATAGLMKNMSARLYSSKPLTVKVDHPFLFYIKAEDNVLFAGRVNWLSQ